MNVLVTGGSGFLGGHFVRALLREGHTVTNLDLVAPPADAPTTRFIQADIREPEAARSAMAGCDALLHLAAAHHDFGIARETFFSVNEGGARILCEAANQAGVRRVCFFSTVAVYGSTPEPRTETAVPQPQSPYGQSKLAAERVFECWAAPGSGRRCLVIRPTVVFGPNHFANLYTLIRQIDSRVFVRVGDGRNVKSLAYVENVVAATLYLWERPMTGPFELYNYADKPDLPTRDILAAIYRAMGRRPPRFHVPLALALLSALPFDLIARATGRDLPISSSRIRKLCLQTRYEADRVLESGFRPAIPLAEGIDRMVRWYLDEGRYQPARRHVPPASLVTRMEIMRGSGAFAEE